MVNIKELRERNRAGSIDGAMLLDSQSDQAISDSTSCSGADSVRPGPGLKLPGPRPISNANKGLIHKRQAPSCKRQALKLSNQPQASSAKRQASQPE